MNLLMRKQWGWLTSGLALALIFLLAVATIKPIGVSTQFVILDGIVMDAIAPATVVQDDTAKKGYSSPNAYLNKSGGKYAKSVAKPMNYSFVFVLAMIAGGFIASRMQSARDKDAQRQNRTMPPVWRARFGDSSGVRHVVSFIGGVLVLFGARLAGGCTSGHMMSGMMQTSVSGYLFALGAFAAAIPVAFFIYKNIKE